MIDALVILGENLFAETLTVSQCLANAERLGMTGVIAAPARGRDYHLGAANDRLAVDSAPYPAIRRLARVDPNQGSAAVDEFRRCIRDLGCVGLFLNPEEEVFRIQDAEPLVREAAGRGVPTVIVAGVPLRSEPLQILDLADRVPEARLVLTSGGQINISGLGMIDAWLALLRNANLSVLSNGEYRQDFLERIARELGPERLLFASFAPYYEQSFEVARISNVGYDPAARALIEGDNALRMFG